MRKLLVIIFFVSSFSLQAQQVETKGFFLQDSIKLGMEVAFSLSVRYPQERDVVFPDSTYNYAPFEFLKKEYFSTKTDSLTSHDSAVYYLTTFEVDSVQYLRLPVFEVTKGDSSLYYTETDSLILHHVVTQIPDSSRVEDMPFKENTSYLPLSLQFNYPYLIIGIIIFFIIILLVLIIFGKRIKKWWKLRRLRKQHEKFKEQFEKAVNDPKHNDPQHVESTIGLWKRYMEKLTNKPYSQLTTTEIYYREKNEQLKKALRQIDRSIYSGKPNSEELNPAYEELNSHAENKFNTRVEEIKHA